MKSITWCAPPVRLVLPPATVHVWKASLMDHAVQSLLRTELPRHEQITGKSVTSLAARAVLRNILSRYLDKCPTEITLNRSQTGKPFLSSGPELNVSHTKDITLIAIADRAVGVDIERSDRRVTNVNRFLSRLTPKEAASIRAASDQHAAFITLWTRKEAFLKCTGYGIRRGLASFQVSIDRDLGWLDAVNEDISQAGLFSTSTITVKDHVAALVYHGLDFEMIKYEWRP